MPVTLDISDDVLQQTIENVKAASPAEAVIIALREYNRLKALDELFAWFGTSETFMTHEELMDMRHEQGIYGHTG